MTRVIQIDESANEVRILNPPLTQVITRPDWISVSEWLKFWERVKRISEECY